MEIDDVKFEQASKDVDFFALVNNIKMNVLRIAKFHPDALSIVPGEIDAFILKISK